jgi:PAS domain S-box-containing protein
LKELKGQIVGALLVVSTVAVLASALINFRQHQVFHLKDDGIVWEDRAEKAPGALRGSGKVAARYVTPDSTGFKAGIREGDVLQTIRSLPVDHAIDVPQILWDLPSWEKVDYVLLRRGVEIKAKVILAARGLSRAASLQYLVGAAYAAIGLFIYFRRGSAPKARHFFILCVASFVLCTFHYTGKLNTFDRVIYWGNVFATFFAPTLFLHFCLTFPEASRRWRGLRGLILYLPALALSGLTYAVASGMLRIERMPLVELRWNLDRLGLLYLACMYLAGGVILAIRHRFVDDSVLRQQMKWLRNGAFLGTLPFTLCYVLPYVLEQPVTGWMELTVLSLAIIPLTWAYAIVRYRLMDVDLIFQQGYVYTLATLSVLAIFYGLVYSVTKFGNLEELSPSGFGILIIIATFVFQPIRNWLQEILDRYVFYKESYNYRRTLIEFARDMGSETDLETMVRAMGERLTRTLSIQHLAFFVEKDQGGGYHLLHSSGDRMWAVPSYLDLSFLEPHPTKPYLFFERTRAGIDVVSIHWTPPVRETIAALDLTYYLPCTVRGRAIAYLGVSRTVEGDFLSSDDVELLTTLSGYVGIAIENARLYNSLQRKVDEYERLKEFNENIVESINVGILAADLEDRVESWNSQIERLTGIRRDQALGRRLGDLLPPELADRLGALRGEEGIHHIDKLRSRLPAGRNGHGPREAILNVAVAPLVSRDHHLIGRLIILDDITDRSELERQLVQADKLSSIGLLAAGVAHEVNTPLAVISTYAQMLAKQLGGDEQKSTLLEKIAKQTFRASEIVNSLLNFSRTSTTEYGEVDLNRLIRETVSLIYHQLQRAQVQVDYELDAAAPPVRGNPGKLQQVLLNLIINARDALEMVERPQGRRILLRTFTEGESFVIEVADNGNGIPTEIMPRIFDPFFTTKGAKKGTGLGLSVSYGIVQEHNGAIRAESAPGVGTRFRLEFPLARVLAASLRTA